MKKRCGVMLVLLLSICLSACKSKGDAKPTTQELDVNEFKDLSEEEIALIEEDFKQLELQVLMMKNHNELLKEQINKTSTSDETLIVGDIYKVYANEAKTLLNEMQNAEWKTDHYHEQIDIAIKAMAAITDYENLITDYSVDLKTKELTKLIEIYKENSEIVYEFITQEAAKFPRKVNSVESESKSVINVFGELLREDQAGEINDNEVKQEKENKVDKKEDIAVDKEDKEDKEALILRKKDYIKLRQVAELIKLHEEKITEFADAKKDEADEKQYAKDVKTLYLDSKQIVGKMKKIKWNTEYYEENTACVIEAMEMVMRHERKVYNAAIGKGEVTKEDIDEYLKAVEEKAKMFEEFVYKEYEYFISK